MRRAPWTSTAVAALGRPTPGRLLVADAGGGKGCHRRFGRGRLSASDAGVAGPPADGSTPVADAGGNDGNASDAGAASDAGTLGKVVARLLPELDPVPCPDQGRRPALQPPLLVRRHARRRGPRHHGRDHLEPPGDGLGAATNLKADIAYARQTQGRKIILSVGGANNGMSFPNRGKSQAFLDSVGDLYQQLGGIDGLDWNTFEGSQAPDTSEMIWISQTLKATYPGFIITAPPAPWNTVDQTFCAQMTSRRARSIARRRSITTARTSRRRRIWCRTSTPGCTSWGRTGWWWGSGSGISRTTGRSGTR